MTIEYLKQELINWRLTKYKLINFLIGASAVLFYEFVGRPYYRPYIYSHNIFDFHIADTLGNSFGTIGAIFVTISILTSNNSFGYFFIKLITFAIIIYEIAQPLLGKPIDPWDILATILSGGISYLIFRWLYGKEDRPTIK